MTSTTRPLASSSGGVAVLNYDDLTLLATGVTIDNISGSETIRFFISILGIVRSATVLKGQTGFISLSPSVAVTTDIAPLGASSLTLLGYDSHGIGGG